ncbi:shikimate dehydrogenase [Desulfovibrio sp. OttesenSCG-928-F20]|nr:shikimate dehydrogenase [Desulfovibrio sp. OttesenSCG-928-F20]
MRDNTIPAPQRLYGILGHPLAQSLSPELHMRSFALLGHAGAYFRWEKKADELPDFFRAVRSLPIAGLSVTVPYKEAVISFLDDISARARAAGAVNTIFWQGAKLLGDNTDIGAFMVPLKCRAGALPRRALVLGAGGAARAALAGLCELAVPEVALSARNREKADELARVFGCLPLTWGEREDWLTSQESALIVNATPLGMHGVYEEQSPFSEETFARLAALCDGPPPFVAYDVVYNPRKTLFLQHAARHMLECLDGLAFFISQAAAQQALWLGTHLAEEQLEAIAGELLRKKS